MEKCSIVLRPIYPTTPEPTEDDLIGNRAYLGILMNQYERKNK